MFLDVILEQNPEIIQDKSKISPTCHILTSGKSPSRQNRITAITENIIMPKTKGIIVAFLIIFMDTDTLGSPENKRPILLHSQ